MSKQAWISTAVFLVLLVLVVVTREDQIRVGMRELSLPKLAKADVTAIEIGGKHKAIVTKSGDAWRVADTENKDKTFPAEQAQVDRALAGIEELTATAFVTGKKDKHAELEIDDEKGTIVTVSTAKGPALRIVLGRFAKGGGNYVRMQGADEVFIGTGALASQVRKDVAGWRDKGLFTLDMADFASVVVEKPGAAAYTIVKKSEGEGDAKKDVFALADGTTLPEGFRLDAESLARLARALSSFRGTGFLDDVEKAKTLAFDQGTLTITKTGGSAPIVVRFAAPDADKKVAAKVDGNDQVFLLSEFTVKNVQKTLDEHRDLSLFPGVDVAQVTAARFSWKGGSATATLAGDAWTYDGPGKENVDPVEIAQKLGPVVKLKAAKILGTAADAKPVFTDEVTVELSLASGEKRTVRFGGETTNSEGKPSGQVFVTSGDGFVYEIGKFQKGRYEKPGDLLKRTERPPPGAGGGMGGMGGMQGLEGLPPEIRKQLEAQLKAQGGH